MMWSQITSIEDIQSISENADFKTLSESWVDAPNRILARFSDQEGALKEGQVYQMQIYQVDKSEPNKKQLMDFFIPAWLVDNVSQEGIRIRSLDEAELTGRKQHAQSTLQPWICSHEIGQILDIPEGTPILRNEWVHYLQDDRIASISESYLTANALVRKFEWGV